MTLAERLEAAGAKPIISDDGDVIGVHAETTEELAALEADETIGPLIQEAKEAVGLGQLEVKATVKMAGLNRGEVVKVDPTDPYIARQLGNRIIVPADGSTWKPPRRARRK